MKLPSVYPLTTPSSHSTSRMIAIVSSMQSSSSHLRASQSNLSAAEMAIAQLAVSHWSLVLGRWSGSRSSDSREQALSDEGPKTIMDQGPRTKAQGLKTVRLRGAERERHRPVDDALAVDARDTLEASHPAAQAQHGGFDLHDVTGVHRPAIADPFDPREERQPLTVLRLCEDHDRADLRDRLGEDRRRQHWPPSALVPQVTLVQRHVLDPDDPLVDLELGD